VAAAFIEIRKASHSGHICVCGNAIGRGDQYKREAVPPWAFRYRDREGNIVDDGDGFWIVLNRCYNCMGGQGGGNEFQSTSRAIW
jgi:hypothetical protein